ncbi:hypothetical protein GCM10010932_08860 [Agromyces flavus]|nr:hypothetical protein GCM10010932_08860 [Agromyces flavus]
MGRLDTPYSVRRARRVQTTSASRDAAETVRRHVASLPTAAVAAQFRSGNRTFGGLAAQPVCGRRLGPNADGDIGAVQPDTEPPPPALRRRRALHPLRLTLPQYPTACR